MAEGGFTLKNWILSLIDPKDANKYRTEELSIGSWIDKKPIYRKVVTADCLNPNKEGLVIILHGIDNIDELVTCRVEWYDKIDKTWNSTSESKYYPESSKDGAADSKSTGITIGGVTVDSTQLIFYCPYKEASTTKEGDQYETKDDSKGVDEIDWPKRTERVRAILEYTKTTDSPTE